MITAFPSNATFLAFAKPFHSPSLNPQIFAMISASPLNATHPILGPYAPNSAVAFHILLMPQTIRKMLIVL